MFVAMLPDDRIDLDAFLAFLLEHREDQAVKGHALQAAQWTKGVCLYDWLRYGKQT